MKILVIYWKDYICGWMLLQSLEDVTGAEFRMFMDFLKSLSLFGEKAPPERMIELIGIIEGQADLDAQFNVSTYFNSCKQSLGSLFIQGFITIITKYGFTIQLLLLLFKKKNCFGGFLISGIYKSYCLVEGFYYYQD